MKRIVLSFLLCLGVFTLMYAQLWPSTIRTGPFKTGHIQGFCVDKQHQCVYYSYTTMLVKTDLKGNIIGTVKGLLGHLGCLAFNEADGRVYGSLEYKDDVIGKGILKMENSTLQFDNAFYVAIFDGDRITRKDMDAEKDGPALYQHDKETRMTKVGKFLREHHLDELPQLWNVVKGEMAFIGPRPERKYYIDQIMEHDKRYVYLYQVRPGVTSYATLYNGYTDTMEKMLRRLDLDLYYLEHRSLWFDAKLLVKTFIFIVFGKKF